MTTTETKTTCWSCGGVLVGDAERYFLSAELEFYAEDNPSHDSDSLEKAKEVMRRVAELGIKETASPPRTMEGWRTVAVGHLNTCDFLTDEGERAGLDRMWADQLLGLIEVDEDGELQSDTFIFLSEEAVVDLEGQGGPLDFDPHDGPDFEYVYGTDKVHVCSKCSTRTHLGSRCMQRHRRRFGSR